MIELQRKEVKKQLQMIRDTVIHMVSNHIHTKHRIGFIPYIIIFICIKCISVSIDRESTT